MTNEYLKIFFFKRLSKYTTDNAFIAGTYEQLFKNYSDRNRRYHDTLHLTQLLKMLELNLHLINNEDVIYFAIWYHKSVYSPWKKNNVELSAELAKDKLSKTQFPEDQTEKVSRYILATENYVSDGTNDMNYFLDFNLSIYASDLPVYEIYIQQLREENGLYPNFLSRSRRKKFLSDLLDKEYIFNTEEFRRSSEKIARENIAFELENY